MVKDGFTRNCLKKGHSLYFKNKELSYKERPPKLNFLLFCCWMELDLVSFSNVRRVDSMLIFRSS